MSTPFLARVYYTSGFSICVAYTLRSGRIFVVAVTFLDCASTITKIAYGRRKPILETMSLVRTILT